MFIFLFSTLCHVVSKHPAALKNLISEMGMAPEFLIFCRGLPADLYNESSYCHVSVRTSIIKELSDHTNLPRFMPFS